MNISGYKLTIIVIYTPNEYNGVTVKDEFFANLNEEIVKSGSGRQLILMEDINGRTGRTTGDTVVGDFGEDMVKDLGEISLKIWNGFLITKMFINIHESNIQKT